MKILDYVNSFNSCMQQNDKLPVRCEPSSAMQCLIHASSCEAMHFKNADQIFVRNTDCSSSTGAQQVPWAASSKKKQIKKINKRNLASEKVWASILARGHITLHCMCERLSYKYGWLVGEGLKTRENCHEQLRSSESERAISVPLSTEQSLVNTLVVWKQKYNQNVM